MPFLSLLLQAVSSRASVCVWSGRECLFGCQINVGVLVRIDHVSASASMF